MEEKTKNKIKETIKTSYKSYDIEGFIFSDQELFDLLELICQEQIKACQEKVLRIRKGVFMDDDEDPLIEGSDSWRYLGITADLLQYTDPIIGEGEDSLIYDWTDLK